MKLCERRNEWERNLFAVLVVTLAQDGYSAVYVVLKKGNQLYNMHRYFKVGDSWEVSVDVQGKTLEDCLTAVSVAFNEVYPSNEKGSLSVVP